MRKIVGIIILLIMVSCGSSWAESEFVRPMTVQMRRVPFSVVVRELRPDLPLKAERPPIPGAEVRMAILLQPVTGMSQMLYFKLQTDSKGECHFDFSPELYEQIHWAIEAEKHFPDGRVFRDVEMPVMGDATQVTEHKDSMRFIRTTVYAYDVNAEDWPFAPRPFEIPLPDDDLDRDLPSMIAPVH